LTLECKIVYQQVQDKNAITPNNLERFYPQDVDSSFYGANKDLHTAYYGQIINAYINRKVRLIIPDIFII